MNEIILYTSNHKCIPNGVGDYTFICPTKGERPGFIPYLYRSIIRGKCECGENVEFQSMRITEPPAPRLEIAAQDADSVTLRVVENERANNDTIR